MRSPLPPSELEVGFQPSHHPFLEFPSDVLAVYPIVEGVRPKKPEGAKWLPFLELR